MGLLGLNHFGIWGASMLGLGVASVSCTHHAIAGCWATATGSRAAMTAAAISAAGGSACAVTPAGKRLRAVAMPAAAAATALTLCTSAGGDRAERIESMCTCMQDRQHAGVMGPYIGMSNIKSSSLVG